jgi:hypothetical protein
MVTIQNSCSLKILNVQPLSLNGIISWFKKRIPASSKMLQFSNMLTTKKLTKLEGRHSILTYGHASASKKPTQYFLMDVNSILKDYLDSPKD